MDIFMESGIHNPMKMGNLQERLISAIVFFAGSF